jgi:glutathione S-transferase
MADGRPYLAGDTFTVADIAGMAALKICDYAELVIDEGLTRAKAWENQVRGRDSWNA